MNECNKHLSPGITCHLVCKSLPKQKQADREVERLYDSYFKEEQLDSQGTVSLCPSNIYLGTA